MASSDPLNISLDGTQSRFEQAAQSVLTAFAQSDIKTGEQVTPPMLVDAVRQMLAVMQKLDKTEVWDPDLPEDDQEQIADYAIGFLQDLATWADRLNEKTARQAMDVTALGVAAWVIRHKGNIRTLEPVVNALAGLANVNQDPQHLLRIAQLMEQVILATDAPIRADLEKDPSRPWRILLMNHAITATRAQDTEQMEHAFELLLKYLPEDAPAFFQEGLQQVSQPGFAPAVQDLMKSYQQKSVGAMH